MTFLNNFSDVSVWDIIVSISTFAAAVFTFFMWLITYKLFRQNKSLFVTANRPWVVISSIKFIINENSNRLTDILIDFHNPGKHPAMNVRPEITILLNNRKLPIKDNVQSSLIIFPNAFLGKKSQLSDIDRKEILVMKLPLEISITVKYESIDKTEKYITGNYEYDYSLKEFINLGESAI
jgi:translation elongation factor P/translation initiation factor 5A